MAKKTARQIGKKWYPRGRKHVKPDPDWVAKAVAEFIERGGVIKRDSHESAADDCLGVPWE